MGCVLVKICDPPLPDNAIRDFWHISGVILDGCPLQQSQSSKNSTRSRTGSSSLEVASAMGAGNGSNAGTDDEPNASNIKGLVSYKSTAVQQRPAGVLYVYNGRLVYRSRRCTLFSRSAKSLQIEICDVQDVKCLNNFTSNNDNKVYSGRVVDISVLNKGAVPFHIGFFTKQAEEVSRQLGETCIKHRQKPKIFQFNSVDVDGVEIDLP